MKEVFQKVLLFFRDHLAPLLYMIFHHVSRKRRAELEKKISNRGDEELHKGDENDS